MAHGYAVVVLNDSVPAFENVRNMIWLQTNAEDRWVLRPEVLEDHCAKDPDAPRIMILNSPSNPTGCVYSEEEVRVYMGALQATNCPSNADTFVCLHS